MFDKICFAFSTMRIVFIPLTLTIADKNKIRVNYFFENYIQAKFHQNRQFRLWYIFLLVNL